MSFTPEYPSLGKRDYTPSPAEQVEQQVDWLVRQVDELIAQATHPESVEVIASQKIGIGQLQTRVQLLLSFLAARQPQPFKVVSNG